MSPAIILIGPPGSGKSTVGAIVAAQLDLRFLDTDTKVEQRAGKSVAEIFIEDGENAFRELEREVVAEQLDGFEGVLALGGGAVMDPRTEELLAGVRDRVVFLDVSLAAAGPRIGFNKARPLLVGNPRAQWQRLMDRRRDVYERIAVASVVTDDTEPADVARAVAKALGLSES